MEPIKKDNEKIEEIKNIEKNEMKELSPEELEGVAGGRALVIKQKANTKPGSI